MCAVDLRPVKATILDDDKFRLLAIPFGGPIPHPAFPRGVDLDGETFTGRTDPKKAWLDARPTDWHHGGDTKMGRDVIGKAINMVEEEDGWWVDIWLDHGSRRLDLIRRLAEQAKAGGKAQIFGSSEPFPRFTAYGPWQGGGKALTDSALRQDHPLRRGLAREVMVWPYMRQTLSTSPQNTLSTIRPLKAALDDLWSDGASPSEAMWSDIESAMRNLSADLRGTPRGDLEAKAGRVLNANNEADLREALKLLEQAMARASAVIGRQPDYSPKEQPTTE
jgi:hypothetical protein